MAKKNIELEKQPNPADVALIDELKMKWLKLAPHEKLGKTKPITKRLDDLENEIKKLKK